MKVLAPLTKKVSCMKRANRKNQFNQKPSFQREKGQVQRFSFSQLQTSHSWKCDTIFATSVMEVEVPCKFKCLLRFLCRYQKILWKEQHVRWWLNHGKRGYFKIRSIPRNSRNPRKICFPSQIKRSHPVTFSIHGINSCFDVNFQISKGMLKLLLLLFFKKLKCVQIVLYR